MPFQHKNKIPKGTFTNYVNVVLLIDYLLPYHCGFSNIEGLGLRKDPIVYTRAVFKVGPFWNKSITKPLVLK